MNLIRRLFAFIFDKTVNIPEEEGHWSDDWDKAEYKIRKRSNDNGIVKYHVFRYLNGEKEMVSHWMGHNI
jgi:hypothetical protein